MYLGGKAEFENKKEEGARLQRPVQQSPVEAKARAQTLWVSSRGYLVKVLLQNPQLSRNHLTIHTKAHLGKPNGKKGGYRKKEH